MNNGGDARVPSALPSAACCGDSDPETGRSSGPSAWSDRAGGWLKVLSKQVIDIGG